MRIDFDESDRMRPKRATRSIDEGIAALAQTRVIRITWRHLKERPEKLAADLRRLLVPS